MFVLVQAITLQPQWLFPSLWKINRRMRNKMVHETRPWEVVVVVVVRQGDGGGLATPTVVVNQQQLFTGVHRTETN